MSNRASNKPMLLSSNEMARKKDVPYPNPLILKAEPNVSPQIMTLQISTFAQNNNWESQKCC